LQTQQAPPKLLKSQRQHLKSSFQQNPTQQATASLQKASSQEKAKPFENWEKAAFLPFGDDFLYLDGTIIAGSLANFLLSSLEATELGTTHLECTGDADLFPLTTGEGSLSIKAAFFFPTETDLSAAAGEKSLRNLIRTSLSTNLIQHHHIISRRKRLSGNFSSHFTFLIVSWKLPAFFVVR
jgi:hypothetical protein